MHLLKSISFLLFPATAFAQTDIVKTERITGPVHQANVGKIVFTTKPIAVDSIRQTDLLKSFDLKPASDLAMKAFLGNSLTNYAHRLAPSLPLEGLTRSGGYQFSYFVDGKLIHKENLHPAWAGNAEVKNTKTVFSATLLNTTDPAAPWGAIWHLFQLNGGAQALTAGNHILRIEMRPYVSAPALEVGDVIASGELPLTVSKSNFAETTVAPRPIQPGSGWTVSTDAYDKQRIRELKTRVAENVYRNIKSVVVIKDGKLLIEEYFNGATRDSLFNTRSAGKSFASTMMGIAIDEGHIKNENQTLGDFYDLKKFSNYSPKKNGVTLASLLTMSSGFDANDDDQSSPGNEENMYPTSNWVKFALDLPMDDKSNVGEKWRYFTAGVVVLGDVIHKSVPAGLEQFADQKLFKPLGITRYQWQYTPQRVANTAGGLQMSALDFAKYGQLYRNGGQWNGKQIVSRAWVKKSFSKQIRLPGFDDYYGYLFWQTSFNVDGKSHEAFYATGNGGNKIYVFTDRPLVVVITATAFGKWYMHRQAADMMRRYILPAIGN